MRMSNWISLKTTTQDMTTTHACTFAIRNTIITIHWAFIIIFYLIWLHCFHDFVCSIFGFIACIACIVDTPNTIIILIFPGHCVLQMFSIYRCVCAVCKRIASMKVFVKNNRNNNRFICYCSFTFHWHELIANYYYIIILVYLQNMCIWFIDEIKFVRCHSRWNWIQYFYCCAWHRFASSPNKSNKLN